MKVLNYISVIIAVFLLGGVWALHLTFTPIAWWKIILSSLFVLVMTIITYYLVHKR